ncbi:MAG: hypothetical protein MUF25_19985, partial [Pirellulaceae bacterium]|nr:hypothetical protein [Pirellulaceae bacterium]
MPRPHAGPQSVQIETLSTERRRLPTLFQKQDPLAGYFALPHVARRMSARRLQQVDDRQLLKHQVRLTP